mmetsp:Transcript_46449/g.61525  ORF Transcript_46449/g.61525 Transcript_46449/m.61525 type:complete len:89 (+) Transcript_46449:357-623(+)
MARDERPLPNRGRGGAGPAKRNPPRRGASGAAPYGNEQNFSDPIENLNYVADKFNQQPEQQKPPGFQRFGGLAPFEHHKVPEEHKDLF